MHHSSSFRFMIVSFALCACGGSSAPGSGASGADAAAPDSVRIDQACAASAKARCQRRDACTNNLSNVVQFGDEATCEAREKLGCIASLGAPGTGATPATVDGCTSAIPSESCTDLLDNNPPPACLPAIGKGAAGASCLFDAECQSTYCAVQKGSACGTCAALPKAGDSCSATGGCGRNLACPSSTEVCVTRAGLSGPCNAGNPCAHGLMCVGATKTAMGTCQNAAQTVGASCDPKQKTLPGCDKDLGLFCDPTTMKCSNAAPAKAGEPCGELSSGVAYCTGGATCQLAAGTKAGTCLAAAADGAACDPNNGPFCQTPAHCVVAEGGTQGTCRLPDASLCK